MNFTLRSTSNSSFDNERLTRKRQAAATAAAAVSSSTTTTPVSSSTTLNRFLSFNENQSSSVENRRRLSQSTPNLIELLEDDDDDIDDYQALCHECNTCSKVFASEYGLDHHTNMHHPNQSILCAICNITFRSHRSLKTHQQRRHPTTQSKLNSNQTSIPNYSHISSYLVLAFSSKQFPLIAKVACEQQRLPLGSFSSKLYQCHICSISFPCSRTLQYHQLDQHEHYEYKTCQKLLSNMINQVEYDIRTVDNNDNDEIETIKLLLAKQASQFGLVNKQLAGKYLEIKIKQNQQIYPRCQHTNRTCANLCLQYLSSYSKLIKTYPYTIPIIPKGNPFAQGSILSPINYLYSNGSSSNNDINVSNELVNGRQKRKSIKQIEEPLSPQLKKRSTLNSKTNRMNSSNRVNTEKQSVEIVPKINETNSVTSSTASSIPKRILPKDNYTRSSSISSNSSTSTRSSMTKSSSSSLTNSIQQSSIISQRTSKRHLSPSVVVPLKRSSEKRRRSREQKLTPSKSESKVIRIDNNDEDENNIEQENGDDDDNDIIPITFEQPSKQRSNKQRQASSESIEYLQILDNDQQSTLSLNNIENIKSKGKINDEEIIICRSPPSARKGISSPNKTSSKTSVNGNGAKKTNGSQSSLNDEHVRVRCKICGDILEGRSRFSKHVITMHSHLLNKNMSNAKHQQQQTAIVR